MSSDGGTRGERTAAEPRPTGHDVGPPSPWSTRLRARLIVTAAVVVAAVGGSAWLVARREASQVREAAASALVTIADLEAGQLAAWVAERKGDAALVRTSDRVRRFLADPADPSARATSLAYLHELERIHGYARLAVYDARGELLLSTQPQTAAHRACASGHARDALAARDVVLVDLHRPSADEPISLVLGASLADAVDPARPPIGAVTLSVDPRRNLAPLVARWPMPTRTGESVLVRRDGDAVATLSDTRRLGASAFGAKVPLSRADAPVVRAVLGEAGATVGPDDGGAIVMAAGRAVPGTPWHVVAKIDVDEVDAPVARELALLGASFVLAALSIAMGVGLRWRHHALAAARAEIADRLRAEATLRASEERLRSLFQKYRGIFDESVAAIYVLDAELRFLDANRAGLDLLGYSRDELLRLRIVDVDADPPAALRPHEHPLAGGRLVNHEHRLRRKDGRVITVLDNSLALTDADGRVTGVQSTLLDITDRKHAEIALETSKAFLDSLFEQSPASMWLSDDEGTLLRLNRACCRTMKVEPDEVVGKYNLFEDRVLAAQGFVPLVRTVFDEGKAVDFELTYDTGGLDALTLRETAELRLEVSIFPIRDPAGKVTHAVVQHVDVTARRHAERALRESEEKLGKLVASARDAILMMGPEGRITLWNEAASRMFGCTAAEAIGQDLHHFLAAPRHQPDAEAALPLFRATGAGPAVGRINELVGRRRDGTELPIELSVAPLRLDDAWHAVGILRDVTARKEAEQELARSRELLRLVLDTVPQAIFWKDAESRYLGCNRTFASFAGVASPADIAGKTDFDLPWLPDESKAYRADDHAVMQAAAPRLHIVETQLRADGSPMWVDTSKLPLADREGHVFGVLGVYDDVTERKRMEDDLRERNEELVRFTYTVSHDLKSPLVTIQTFVGYLEGDVAKGQADRVAADITYIQRAAAKMHDLLEELLALSRVGRKMNPSEHVPFGAVVEAAVDVVAGQLTARGVDLHVHAAPLLLFGDRVRLVEVFQNLLDNAVKFMGPEPAPRVDVGAELVGREHVFYVRDNGLGIDPRHQAKLFGLFEKLHPELPGSGMGLALIKRIVEVHGGRIWVESAGVGRGSTFRFTLRDTKVDEKP